VGVFSAVTGVVSEEVYLVGPQRETGGDVGAALGEFDRSVCGVEATLSFMGKNKSDAIKWLPEVEDHNYPAAESYLSLLHGSDQVTELVAKLREAPIVRYKAKDVFRASQLSLLGISNSHVEKDRKKIRKGVALSPLLLVRSQVHGRVVIADGYHRLCALYGFNEDAWLHCKIV
jgi:hypothetical protein